MYRRSPGVIGAAVARYAIPVRPGPLLRTGALTAGLLLGIACGSTPRPLVAGADACDYCRMTVSDVRFGAELQSRTGKIHTFDSIECLASFYLDAAGRDDVRAAWVTDFENTALVPVDSAVFLEGSTLNSPMGRSLVAFAPGGAVPDLERRYGGRLVAWPDVLDQLRKQRLMPGSDRPTARDAGGGHDHGRRG